MMAEFKTAKFYRDRLTDSQNKIELNKMLTYVYEQIEKSTNGHVIAFLTDDCGVPKFEYDKNTTNCLCDKLRDNGFEVRYVDWDILDIKF